MKFDKAKKYLFDMALYLSDECRTEEELDFIEQQWVQLCNQKEVIVLDEHAGVILEGKSTFMIIPKWCVEKPRIKQMIIS